MMNRKLSKNGLRSAIAAIIIFTTVVTMPCVNFATRSLWTTQSATQQLVTAFTEISRPELSEAGAYFVAKAEQEQTLTSSKRAAQTANLIPERLVVFSQARLIAGLRTYRQANDLHYNLPHLIYLLSTSEHATEG